MPIVIRELQTIDDGKAEMLKVYKPDNHRLTVKEKNEADKLDQSLEREIKKIEKETKKLGLQKLLGKKGAIKFWYEVGLHLNKFLENNKIPKPEQKYFFDSVAQYAVQHKLFDGTEGKRRNMFDYASRIAKHPKDFAITVDLGIWTHIYDSTLTKEDRRISTWIIEKMKHMDGVNRDWFRGFFTEMNGTLKNYETVELNNQEISEKLEEIKKQYDERNMPDSKILTLLSKNQGGAM